MDITSKELSNIIDCHVGQRVRNRRKLLKMSQEDLAKKVGKTFQQLQKYEKGTNRISASVLYYIAAALKVRPEYFYEGLDSEDGGEVSSSEGNVNAFLSTGEGIELASSFPLIRTTKVRRRVLELVRSLADE